MKKWARKVTFNTIRHPIREGRINTTTRYQHTQSQMAKNKMVTIADAVVDVETDYLFITSGTKKKKDTHFEKIACSYHTKQQLYSYTFISERREYMSHEIVCMNVYRSSMNNILKLETTQLLFERRTFESVLIHPHHDILLINKKELIDTKTWMNFQRITLSKESQFQCLCIVWYHFLKEFLMRLELKLISVLLIKLYIYIYNWYNYVCVCVCVCITCSFIY